MGGVVGVVLGAGASTRLGRPKQTLPFGARTLLGHVVADGEASSLDRVIVVLGGAADDAAAALHVTRAQTVRNDGYGEGCASSLLAGLAAAGDCDAIVLLLGDMPGVDPDLIDEVVTAWRTSPSWAAVTEYRDTELGHPFVFSRDAFATLRGLHGDKAVWKIVDTDSRVVRIPVDRTRPRDIDTWDDYIAVRDEFGVEPVSTQRAGVRTIVREATFGGVDGLVESTGHSQGNPRLYEVIEHAPKTGKSPTVWAWPQLIEYLKVAGQPVQGPWPPHQERRPDPDYESLAVAIPDSASAPQA